MSRVLKSTDVRVALRARQRGFLLNPFRFGGGSDSSFSSVIALMHGNGTNGSTTLTDSSPAAKTYTAFGNAQLSTAEKKWGTASMLFDGTGDYFRTTDNMSDFAFGTGDFTVEVWVKTTSTGAYCGICGNYQIAQNTFTLFMDTSGLLVWAIAGANIKTSATSINTGAWVHVAVCRSGTTLRMFVDGVQQGGDLTDATTYTSGTNFRVGDDGSSTFWNGNIDDLRITNGVARYTANFTPPTAEFPDS